ncbi:MAG TPA: hypothetical protein VGD99_03925 [Anaerolineae bacterium]|jgi:hypothetical protein
MLANHRKVIAQFAFLIILPALLLLMLSAQLAGQVQAQEPNPTPFGRVLGNNLIKNGDFEEGFYPVGELGFEPGEVGNIPFEWNWYRSDAYGKYDIDNNEGFGLVCPVDLVSPLTRNRNSLSFYMQSSDQPDARLGVYQTVEVVPGRDYLFSISGTIQVQLGGSSPDINHRVQLAFDHSGNTDWRAVPEKEWINLPWREQDLEFELSGAEDPDLAKIQEYFSIVRAKSNKMTIFLTGWRRWANWRTSIFTLDCVSLVPMSTISVTEVLPNFIDQSTTDVDTALGAAAVIPAQSDTAEGETATAGNGTTAPAPGTTIIPPSGGVLETRQNSMLFMTASVVIIFGLVGAGFWNIRRQKQ